jgi:hypothetical protein
MQAACDMQKKCLRHEYCTISRLWIRCRVRQIYHYKWQKQCAICKESTWRNILKFQHRKWGEGKCFTPTNAKSRPNQMWHHIGGRHRHRCFKLMCCHTIIRTVKINAVYFTETSVPIYRTSRCHIPDDPTHHWQNLKPQTSACFDTPPQYILTKMLQMQRSSTHPIRNLCYPDVGTSCTT